MERSATLVLVNGLWMPRPALWWLQGHLRRRGFDVRVFSYPTVRCDLRGNAAALNDFLHTLPGDRVHLVGYSLGGLVIRALFHDFPEQRPGRIVTLGTPHTGSHAAQRVARWPGGSRILGHGVADLLAGIPRHWTWPARQFGTVAGDLGFGLGRLFGGLPRPHDGTVTVAEACPPQASASCVLPTSHLGLLLMPAVGDAVAAYLRNGMFPTRPAPV